MYWDVSILAAIGAMLCWGVGDFFIQRTTRKIGDIETIAFMSAIGAIGLTPFILSDIPLLFEFQNILIIFILSIAALVAAVLNFEALKQGKLSVIDVVLEIEIPVTVILGFLFFQESLSIVQVSVIGFMMAGITLIATGHGPLKLRKVVIEKGVFLAVLAAIAMGFVNLLTAVGSRQISPLMIIWTPWTIAAIMSFIFLMKRDGIHKTIKNASKFKSLILAMGIFETAAWLLFAIAVFNNMLSITIAITESFPAVALLLGLWINKERITKYQYAGAVITLISCFFLGLK
jgi:drug/metabolite transporter (DMT)-like permease